MDGVVSGNTVLLVDRCSEVIILSTKGWKSRAVEEPTSEKVLRGPKEGFTESLATNLTMIRRKVRSRNLKFHHMIVGEKTRTRVCICYIDGLIHEDVLNNLIDKIGNINIDGMLALMIHLFSLRSCCIPFMDNLTSLHMQSLKDTIIRAPAWYMRYRPKFISKNSKRASIGGKGDE